MMSYLKIEANKITGEAKRGERIYELTPFFMPTFPFKRDGNRIIFSSEYENSLKENIEEENKKRLNTYLLAKRAENKPNKIKEVCVKQGTKEWLLLRKGLVTASKPCFNSKGLPIQSFNEYVNKKVADKFESEILGEALIEEELEKEFKNEVMQNGNDLEAKAIARYEEITGNKVVHKGFVTGDSFGVSHDGITTDKNFNKINIEVKNLITNTYLSQLTHRVAEKRYYAQMQMQMYVLDCDLTHLVIQCQREEKLGVEMELLIVEVKRDEEFIMNMMETLKKFEKEFDYRYKILSEKVLKNRTKGFKHDK